MNNTKLQQAERFTKIGYEVTRIEQGCEARLKTPKPKTTEPRNLKLKIKLKRAYGGCLGTRSRRRT